jgi:hypothetical protein
MEPPQQKDLVRWRQAWTDTKGFVEWKRNALVALLPTALQFLVQHRLDPTGAEPVKTLLWAGFTFGVAFVVIPLFEFVWSYFRVPLRKATADVARLERALAERDQSIAELKARIVTLSARFKIDIISVHMGELVNQSTGEVASYMVPLLAVANTGERSVVTTWKVEVALSGRGAMQFQVRPRHSRIELRTGQNGPVQQVLDPDESIIQRTIARPIDNGGRVFGHLFCLAPQGVTMDDLSAPDVKVMVSCQDVDGEWFSSPMVALTNPRTQGRFIVPGMGT